MSSQDDGDNSRSRSKLTGAEIAEILKDHGIQYTAETTETAQTVETSETVGTVDTFVSLSPLHPAFERNSKKYRS